LPGAEALTAHGRAIAAVVLAALLLVPAGRAAAGAGDSRTLVVRGRVLAPDGTPVPGARVSAHGSANTTAMTDERGRYSLSVPVGSAAGLRRGAFALEVQAEHDGRRLALGGGASALGIEIALAPGGGRVRVRSNTQDATTAVATAFAQDGAATAWVEADFGGAARPGGAPVLGAVDEVVVEGAPAGAARDSLPVPARRAPRTRVAAPRPVKAARDSARSARTPRIAVTGGRAAVATPDPTPRPAKPPAMPPVTAVVSLPERAAGTDSCACRVRGTVEIDWERPLERDFPIELALEGPASQRVEVDMFMGSPREFHFGPLPCGEYRLVMRPGGRLRYVLERGDSVLAVPCHGLTQARVVLVPARH
jgi:hypothetical protein